MNLKAYLKRILCTVLVVITLLTSVPVEGLVGVDFKNPFVISSQAASLTASWSFSSVSNLSTTDAQIKATVSFSKNVKISKCGFYIGTSKDKLKINAKPDTINKSYKSLPMWYLMSKYGEKLKANTTYYYKFYAVVGGKYYYSPVKSFKTKAASTALTDSWNFSDVTNLTTTDAQIKATVNFSKNVKISKCGFYIGTSKDNLKINAKPDIINKSCKSLPLWYLMSKYGEKLKANTTYYYKFYAVVDGKIYDSPVKSFKTKADTKANWKSSWVVYTKNVGKTNMQIQFDVSMYNTNGSAGQKSSFTEAGFYFGTSEKNLTKYRDTFSKAYKDTILSRSYSLSKYNIVLEPSTKYYYKAYVIANGKEHSSAVQNFTTKYVQIVGNPITYNYAFSHKVSNAKDKSATLNATLTFDKKVKATENGIYIGTNRSKLQKATKVNKMNKTSNTFTWSYNIGSLTALKENTTYYYKLYAIIGGKTYYSTVKSFKTVASFDMKVQELKKKYPQGTAWNGKKSAYGGTGCFAFAATCVNYVKGKQPKQYNNKTFADIKLGDMVHYRVPKKDGTFGQHWVFVIAKDSDSITVAEGNYGTDKKIVNWGRKIEKSYLDKYMYKTDSLRRA